MTWVPFCSAGMAIGQACRDIVDGDPHMLAKDMRMSSNAEVREYGYRLELALMRQEKKRDRTTPTGKEMAK